MSRISRFLIVGLLAFCALPLLEARAEAGPFVRVFTAPARFVVRKVRPVRRAVKAVKFVAGCGCRHCDCQACECQHGDACPGGVCPVR